MYIYSAYGLLKLRYTLHFKNIPQRVHISPTTYIVTALYNNFRNYTVDTSKLNSNLDKHISPTLGEFDTV